MAGRPYKCLSRPPQPDVGLLFGIKAVIADMPTYGYRRVHAILCRKARAAGEPLPNHKRVYRVMKAHGLLLQRHAGDVDARRHDGRVAVDRSNLRWCSDGFEIGCDKGEKVRVALECRPTVWTAFRSALRHKILPIWPVIRAVPSSALRSSRRDGGVVGVRTRSCGS